MGFETVSIIVFLTSVLGIIIIILRHLPDAVINQETGETVEPSNLQEKGLAVESLPRWRSLLRFWNKRLWNFILEAKDVRPRHQVGYRLRKMIRRNKQAVMEAQPIIPPPTDGEVSLKDEAYFLAKIKNEPKNFEHYKGLGTYYLDSKLFNEAKDVFKYLSDHIPGDAGVSAKLAYTYFHLKDYPSAVESYKKSIALDSTHPNRYYNLSLCYEAVKDYAKAIESLEKAVQIEPENQKYKEALNRFRYMSDFEAK